MPIVRPAQKLNPSMEDVAQLAGVSVATVSNVINRPEKVTETTTRKVRTAIDSLGFVRNDAARSLALGTTSSIGLVLADLENTLFIDITAGAQIRARSDGLRLVVGNSACDLQQQDDYLDLFDETRVSGILLAPMEDSTAGLLRMRSHGRPVVLINYAPATDDFCAVLEDNEMVGYLAAMHLIETGRRRLAFVAGFDHYQPVSQRRLGFERAARESGLGVTIEEIDTRGLLRSDGLATAAQLAKRRRDAMPDGIVAVTDAIGNGLVAGLMEAGFDVPGDIGIVGCEDTRTEVAGPVRLTTVSPPGYYMGVTAVELLLEESAGRGHEHRTITLPPTLQVHASSVAAD